jgi:hypothetical protein
MLYEVMGEWGAVVTETSTYELGRRRSTWGSMRVRCRRAEPATQVEAFGRSVPSTHVPPQKTQARQQRTFFFPGAPFLCLGEQTCRVKGSSGVEGGRPSVGPVDKGGVEGGQGKADSSRLGELSVQG